MDPDPRIRIYVVDDFVEVRDLVRRVVAEDDNIDIVGEAPNGAIALEEIEHDPPDLVVTDVQMPVMDGIELTRSIREQWPELHVLAISARNDRETVAAMAKAGASCYVDKDKLAQLLVPLIRALVLVDDPVIRFLHQEEDQKS